MELLQWGERTIWILCVIFTGWNFYKQGYLFATKEYLRESTKSMLELNIIEEEDVEETYNSMLNKTLKNKK